jgi:RHS repeat-associated protein
MGWIGDLGSGNGSPGSLQGPEDSSGNTVPDYHPGNGKGIGQGQGKTAASSGSSSGTLSTSDTAESQTLDEALADVIAADTEVTDDITTDLVKENPIRYAGYYWDRKTQYFYLQARYYDPRPARFISEDTYEGEIENPQSLNLYAYVQNNSLNYVDPTGHFCVSLDGKYSHSGYCSPGSSVYLGSDKYYQGFAKLSNGRVIGYLNSYNVPYGNNKNFWDMYPEQKSNPNYKINKAIYNSGGFNRNSQTTLQCLKKGVTKVVSADWNKIIKDAKVDFKAGVNQSLRTDWKKTFSDANRDFNKGFNEFLIYEIGENDYNSLTDGKLTFNDAKIVFMAYVNFESQRGAGGKGKGIDRKTSQTFDYLK